MARHNATGKWGERIAYEYLLSIGYAIVETNWRLGHYEIDLIASKGNRMIFVEVKTRSNIDYDPLEAVDNRKKNHLIRSADVFLNTIEMPFEVQYDIITIVGDQHNYKLEHIPDAFFPSVVTRRGVRSYFH